MPATASVDIVGAVACTVGCAVAAVGFTVGARLVFACVTVACAFEVLLLVIILLESQALGCCACHELIL